MPGAAVVALGRSSKPVFGGLREELFRGWTGCTSRLRGDGGPDECSELGRLCCRSIRK